MVSNAEMFTSDDSPNDAANSWDMSDAENSFEYGDEKSEEEKQYEARERSLKSELESIVDGRARTLFEAAEECGRIFHAAEHPFANRFDQAFDSMTGSAKGSGQETLEMLFEYIDSKFPSPYKNSSEIVPDVDEYGRKKLDEAEDNFIRASMREGNILGENTDEIAKLFRIDGSQNDLHIADSLRHLSDSIVEYRTNFARAIIGYVNEPTKETRSRLTRTQSNHEGVLSNSLFNIAATFDESKTHIGRKLFDPTIILATNLTRGSEEYFDSIMDYLRFKMENTDDEHRPRDDVDSDVDNSNAFLAQPDIIMR